MDPVELEKLRENSHIRLDREGRFWHEEALVEHPRVAAAFHRGLGRAPDGRPTIRLGRTWCYIEAEGPLYQARQAACWEDGAALTRCVIRLDDESEEEVPLAPGLLKWDGDDTLLVRVKGGTEWARCSSEAQRSLGRYLDDEGRLLTVNGVFAIDRA